MTVDVVVVNDDLVEVRPGHGIVIEVSSDGVTCPQLADTAAFDALAGGDGAPLIAAVRRVVSTAQALGDQGWGLWDVAGQVARAVASEAAPRYLGTRRDAQRAAAARGSEG